MEPDQGCEHVVCILEEVGDMSTIRRSFGLGSMTPSMMASAFFVFPFTFALQVLTHNEKMGLLPYLLLGLNTLGVLTSPSLRGRLWHRTRDVGFIDIAVAMLVVFSTSHIFLSFVFGDASIQIAVKSLLVYVCSGWVFYYVSRVASEKDIRMMLIAIAIAATLIGLHWIFDTYMKMVRRDPGEFAKLAYEYIKYRNGSFDGQANHSILHPEYRSYGLLDRHTSTGAMVVLGGFAALGIAHNARLYIKFAITFCFFLTLSIGMAGTAWVGFVTIAPIALILGESGTGLRHIAARLVKYLAFAAPLALLVVLGSAGGRAMLMNFVDAFSIQFALVSGFGLTADQVPFFKLYVNEVIGYVEHLSHNPIYFLTGEGYTGYGSGRFARGGDCALFEMLVTYGLPFSFFLLSVFTNAIRLAIGSLRAVELTSQRKAFLVFAGSTTAFLILTLAHYNTFFNKTFFVFAYFSLALVRRYSLPTRS